MKNTDSIRPSAEGDDTSEVEESSVMAGVGTMAEEDQATEEEMQALIEETESADDAEDRAQNVVKLLPVHAAPNTGKNALKVQRKVGRPRKVERMPTTSDLEYHAKMTEEKNRFVETDPVVKATKGRADASDVLHTIKIEVARETAALHFQRIENEKFGKDTAQVSSRRIEALKKIADIELEIKKLGADAIDLRSEKMQRVFAFFVQQIKDVASESLPPEQVDLFFNRLSTALEGWEDKCSELIASK